MEPRRGRLVRPLLAVWRDDRRDHCRRYDLAWREDAANEDPRFARARIRHEVMPVLREIAPQAERTIVETAELLSDEAEILEAAAAEVSPAELSGHPPALARIALRRAAGQAISRRDADAILAMVGQGGTKSLDLPGGLRAIVEYGTVRFSCCACRAR